MSKPVVLVTGASGLVGAYVVNEIVKIGSQKVIAQFRNTPSTLPDSVVGLSLDLASPSAVDTLSKFKPDVIVHCAASVPGTESDDQAATVNREIDAAIFNAAQAINASVIFCSSVSLYYGLPIPWFEDAVLSPCTPYATAKLESELLFSGLKQGSVMLRISSPYGSSHQDRRGVLYTFVRSALSGKDIRVYGSGQRTQDFIHASDIAKVVGEFVKRWDASRGLLCSGVFNVGSGQPVTMETLARMVIEKSSSTSRLLLDAGDDAQDDFRSYLDISKIKKTIGWSPEISIERGVEELIKLPRML